MSQPAVKPAVATPATGRDTSRLSYRILPILDTTRRALLELGRGVALSTSRVAELAVADPGLALQILSQANLHANDGSQLEVSGVSHAVSMLGMEQTLELVSRLRAIDTIKPGKRRDGLMHALGRAAHASGLARRWSKRRGDPAAEVAALAVLVRHAAEIALWAGDTEAQTLFARLHHAGDRRRDLEVELLGCTLSEFGERLAVEARVPAALRAAVDDSAALQARLAPCVLASALAESTALDWHSPRSVELITLYGELSAADPDRALATLYSQTADIARDSPLGGSMTAARYALLPPGERFEAEELLAPADKPAAVKPAPVQAAPRVVPVPRARTRQMAAAEATTSPSTRQAGEPTPKQSAMPPPAPRPPPENTKPAEQPSPKAPASVGVTGDAASDQAAEPPPADRPPPDKPAAATQPQPAPAEDPVLACQRLLGDVRRGATTIQAALPEVIDTVRAGFGFERVVFALKDREQATLRARYTSGEPKQPALEVDLSRPNLVTRMLEGSQGIWLHAGTREKLRPYLPRSVRGYADERDFCVVSLFVRDKGVGVIYADYRGAHVDEQAYARFKRIALLVADTLAPRRKAGG